MQYRKIAAGFLAGLTVMSITACSDDSSSTSHRDTSVSSSDKEADDAVAAAKEVMAAVNDIIPKDVIQQLYDKDFSSQAIFYAFTTVMGDYSTEVIDTARQLKKDSGLSDKELITALTLTGVDPLIARLVVENL